MLFNTNKEISNSSLGIAIAYFSSNGYIVSVPLNDTQDYDLVVDLNNQLYKVQVKGTSFKTKYGVYQVALKSSGGTSGKVYKTIKDTDVDLVFIVTKDKDMYLIPKDKIRNKYSLNLGNEFQKYHL